MCFFFLLVYGFLIAEARYGGKLKGLRQGTYKLGRKRKIPIPQPVASSINRVTASPELHSYRDFYLAAGSQLEKVGRKPSMLCTAGEARREHCSGCHDQERFAPS